MSSWVGRLGIHSRVVTLWDFSELLVTSVQFLLHERTCVRSASDSNKEVNPMITNNSTPNYRNKQVYANLQQNS